MLYQASCHHTTATQTPCCCLNPIRDTNNVHLNTTTGAVHVLLGLQLYHLWACPASQNWRMHIDHLDDQPQTPTPLHTPSTMITASSSQGSILFPPTITECPPLFLPNNRALLPSLPDPIPHPPLPTPHRAFPPLTLPPSIKHPLIHVDPVQCVLCVPSHGGVAGEEGLGEEPRDRHRAPQSLAAPLWMYTGGGGSCNEAGGQRAHPGATVATALLMQVASAPASSESSHQGLHTVQALLLAASVPGMHGAGSSSRAGPRQGG